MYPGVDTIRVLHVDDEPEFAATTTALLEHEDDRLDIETAANASEGLSRLTEEPFDCVVSDYDMPGQNGIEFLKAVREVFPELSFVLFTGKGSEEVASDAISAGVTDYLQKETGTSQYALLANRIINAVEQHRGRLALQESEKRLSLFIEQSPLGVVEYDENFEIVRVNPAAEEIFGYSEAELQGETWKLFVTEHSYENVEAVTEALMDASGGFHSIDENRRKDGERIMVEWHNRVVTDETGAVVAVFALCQDITNRVKHQRELESTQRRLDAILENTTIPIFMKDEEGRYLFVNRGYCDLFGYDDESVVGRTDRELFSQETAAELMGNDRTVLDRGEPIEREERLLVDEAERIFLSTKVPIYDTGERSDPDNPVAIFGIAVDITDRTERERELKRYQTLMNTMQEAACLYDEEARFELANQYLADFYGTTPAALVGRESRLIPVIRANAETDPYQELLDGERDVIRGEIESEFPGRGVEVLEYTLAPLWIDGEIDGVIGAAHEITSYKQRERELEQTNEQLDSFTKVVSHDLRNPLSVAQGRLELAMEECDSEHLQSAKNAIDRSQELVDDLLTIARSDESVRNVERVDLGPLVSICWDAVVSSDETLVVDTQRVVQADRSRLRQLLENLLRNAVDHGGTTVTVADLDDGFYVADDGPGIPANERESVFEAGYSTNSEGTGFGLAIVQEVADDHGWTVSVTDSESGGARFEITGVDD